MGNAICPTCGSTCAVVGDTTKHFEPIRTQRVATSAANFYLGELLLLRAEDGAGTWEVIEVLPRTVDNFARAIIERRA